MQNVLAFAYLSIVFHSFSFVRIDPYIDMVAAAMVTRRLLLFSSSFSVKEQFIRFIFHSHSLLFFYYSIVT